MHTVFSCPGQEQLHLVRSGIIAPQLGTCSGSAGTGGIWQPHGAGGAKGGDTECPQVSLIPSLQCGQHLLSPLPGLRAPALLPSCPEGPGEGTNSGSTRKPPKLAGRAGGLGRCHMMGPSPCQVWTKLGGAMRCPTPTHCDLKEQRGMREQLTGERSRAQLPQQVLCPCYNYTALIGQSSESITLYLL